MREMKSTQKNPMVETIKDNPWYNDDQLQVVHGYTRRSIQRRYDYILESIEDYLNSYCLAEQNYSFTDSRILF